MYRCRCWNWNIFDLYVIIFYFALKYAIKTKCAAARFNECNWYYWLWRLAAAREKIVSHSVLRCDFSLWFFISYFSLSLSLYLYLSFSLSAAVAIFIALATIEEKYWNRSRAVTFREMRSGSSGGDWLSTLKLHKHSCIVPERRRNEWIKDTLARGVLAWEIAKPRCFVVAISDWKKHVHIYDSVENCVS